MTRPEAGLYEEVRPQSEEALDIETVIDHCPECFRGNSTVPVRFGYPVADFGISLPYSDVALSVNEVPHTTYRLSGLAQSDGPGAVIGEDVPDYLLLSSMSLCGGHPALGPTSGSEAYRKSASASESSHGRRMSLSVSIMI